MAVYDAEGNEIPLDPTAARIAAVGKVLESATVAEVEKLNVAVARLIDRIAESIVIPPRGQVTVLPAARVDRHSTPATD